ncbi:MAG: hypothetical protein ACP5M8_07760 [Caldisphaera sp.]
MVQKTIYEGKLKSLLENGPVSISFNLVDFRNNLFTSNNPDDIIEFYNTFKDRDSLIKWMRERPKGVSYIHEVEGRKDIIVVIPTADFNGKYAKTCREEIFKGLHMVFVESGVGNFYFNYAHNCNIGIKKALEYDPKWIIVSNDDMYKVDDVSVLIKQLENINNKDFDVIFIKPGFTHSRISAVGSFTLSSWMLFFIFSNLLNHKFWRVFPLSFQVYKINKRLLGKKFFSDVALPDSKINSHNKILYYIYLRLTRLLFKYNTIGDFGIFSSIFIKNNMPLFDENYINGVEDVDLQTQIKLKKLKYKNISWEIGDYISVTFGKNITRTLRDISNLIYYNYKFQNNLFDVTRQ